MEPNSPQWVGSPCGLHGPYIFYKAFKFHLEGRPRILSLGDFFFVRCKPEDPICIAELQLLWEERTTKQLLSSSKLYFLPEDTPQGRTVIHGEDEVIAVSEKVIVKLDNLVKWASLDCSDWKCGLKAIPLKPSVQKELGKNGQRDALQKYRQSTLNSGLNFKDVLKEKAELGEDDEEKKVLILSYPQYCRYRSMIARLQETPSSLLSDQMVLALGGIAALNSNTQILYCRDTFDHPTLIENESICDEFAPNLKGRPRKKKLSISQRRDSQTQNGVSSSSSSEGKAFAKVKTEQKPIGAKPKSNGNCKKTLAEDHSKMGAGEECRADEQAFLVALYKYMKERKTPIERIPYLGFKQINLWTMFQAAQKLGGYELITARRQWKNVYDELGGNPGSTSAATCTRRHYERLILPYERHIKGEEDKPLPPVKPRKQEASPQEGQGKPKVNMAKRIKSEQIQKPKKEKETKVLEECGAPDPGKTSVDVAFQSQQQITVKVEVKDKDEAQQSTGLVEVCTSSSNQNIIKEEVVHLATVPSPSSSSKGSSLEGETNITVTPDATVNTKQESRIQSILDKLSIELQEKAASAHCSVSPQPAAPSTQPSQEEPVTPERCSTSPQTKADPTGFSETQNSLDKSPLLSLKQQAIRTTLVSENGKEKDAAGKDEVSASYSPVLYPRSNSGIMSPLAKKKLLSQVSGTCLPNSYSFGSSQPLVLKKIVGSNGEEVTVPPGPQVSTPETIMVSRPSVIQHAQSFKARNSDERKAASEVFKNDMCGKSDSFPCDLSKHQMSSSVEHYRSDVQEKEKSQENRTVQPCQMPTYFAEFYSSPHLHSLYRHAEHHLNKEQLSKYLSRETLYIQDHENVSPFAQKKHLEKTTTIYRPPMNEKDKMATSDISSDDQPTDLSLPKSSAHKLPSSKPLTSSMSQTLMQQENKNAPLFQATRTQVSGIDCNPKACRVPPMTMSTPKKPAEPLRASGKPPSSRGEDVAPRPILSTKTCTQNVGAARPLKRNLEELESGTPEKKIRAVTPMHMTKETSSKTPEPDGEASKSVETTHAGSLLDSHKFPLPTPIFSGIYPGTFVSQVQDMCDSLGSHLPAGYSHPLQYLKNQAVISPLMPPLTIHSIMMQRQLLSSSANPPQIYRHLATAAAPVGPSYGELLHHGLYPLSALNPQSSFNPSQLSSVHPSTKL
ncbi:AT-rich interactive domain-containing protein 5B [Erpetoichthys calabaricus]|nr:AT-rich interactive domain-containing protein 5B [Erpetoichthys calabaricus]